MANTAVYVGLFLTPIAIPHVLAASSWPVVWWLAGLVALAARPCFPARQRRNAVDAAHRVGQQMLLAHDARARSHHFLEQLQFGRQKPWQVRAAAQMGQWSSISSQSPPSASTRAI
jgi:hypothetical protein